MKAELEEAVRSGRSCMLILNDADASVVDGRILRARESWFVLKPRGGPEIPVLASAVNCVL